jgi:hypothetical protein
MSNTKMNSLLKKLERDFGNRKDQPEAFPRNPETGLPEPKNFSELLATVREVVYLNRSLFSLQKQLEEALPPKDGQKDPLTNEEFQSVFLSNDRTDDPFKMMFAVNPLNIALVALDHFFKDERFELIDPSTLPYAKDLLHPYEREKITHTTIEIGGNVVSTPVNKVFWLNDKTLGTRFIIDYKPVQGGQVSITVFASYDDHEKAMKLIADIKISVLQSPLIRGQVVEISAGSGFNVVDLGEQPFPIISQELADELEKNVINIFDKSAEFEAMGQAICRKIILSGGPGNGKTMIERYLASRLRGKVTTIWVSAKSIEHREHIDEIFEIARKLSPSLIVMEDLDLISGSRSHYGNENMLGEMLNQLDGLKKNDAIVVVASTNKVADLDEALNDRPERFDRIFEVGKPTQDLAVKIAEQYLTKKCKISAEVVESLNLKKYFGDKEFSGAQIVEVIRGAIFEAIHRGMGKEINQQCIMVSKAGLIKQRELITKNQT